MKWRYMLVPRGMDNVVHNSLRLLTTKFALPFIFFCVDTHLFTSSNKRSSA